MKIVVEKSRSLGKNLYHAVMTEGKDKWGRPEILSSGIGKNPQKAIENLKSNIFEQRKKENKLFFRKIAALNKP